MWKVIGKRHHKLRYNLKMVAKHVNVLEMEAKDTGQEDGAEVSVTVHGHLTCLHIYIERVRTAKSY